MLVFIQGFLSQKEDIMNTKQGIEYLEKGEKSYFPCAFFLHGYGANARDLSGFSNLPLACKWIFPNGPLKLKAPYESFSGRAWFPLPENTGASPLLKASEAALYQMEKHCQNLTEFIKSFKLKPQHIILGGFSQGAIMALNIALCMDPPPRALIFMSGALFPQEVLQKNKHKFSRAGNFFQCHGTKDPLLAFAESRAVCDFLQDLKWKGEFLPFEGGHEIPQTTLFKIQNFIANSL